MLRKTRYFAAIRDTVVIGVVPFVVRLRALNVMHMFTDLCQPVFAACFTNSTLRQRCPHTERKTTLLPRAFPA